MSTARGGAMGKAGGRHAVIRQTTLHVCGHQMATPPRWTAKRPPVCNRIAGHEGPHRQSNPRDFTIEAEEVRR
jgi:hypothetical protein